MNSPKKGKVDEVEEFLTKTGFILEMEVAELLRKKGFKVEVNKYFEDYDENKKREIDIIASKQIGEITLILVVECKQSLVDDWIFICSDKRPARYYTYLKHTPSLVEPRNSKVVDHLHLFDHAMPSAQNHVIKSRDKKKSTSIQVDTCLEKLPKALVDLVRMKSTPHDRKIYLPIAVFSGDLFTAQYNKKLQVKITDWVQYKSSFVSAAYTYHYVSPFLNRRMYTALSGDDGTEQEKRKTNSVIAETSQKIGYEYLIDFVNKKGLIKLITRIESDISKVDLLKWAVVDRKKEE